MKPLTPFLRVVVLIVLLGFGAFMALVAEGMMAWLGAP